MGLVDGIWYDNRIKDYPKKWNKHYFRNLKKNSTGIPIVVCEHCGRSRMNIMLMEEEIIELDPIL